jgi:polyphosphate kinase
MHHPYEGFGAVIDLLAAAAATRRCWRSSRRCTAPAATRAIIEHLIAAARNGKDVTVVVELRARFDEEANLNLADRLQEAGVQVMYGVVGPQDPRQDADDRAARRPGAAPLRAPGHRQLPRRHRQAYTDIGLMTADPDIATDVHGLFQQLSGLAPAIKLKRLMASPFTLHAGLLQRIEREAKLAKPARAGTSSPR